MTPEPGHYVEPAFSPDGSMITYRKTSDGYLTTPLWGRDPGLYVVPTRGGTPKRVAKDGEPAACSARTDDRIFFSADGEEGKHLLKSVSLNGTDEVTHLISRQCRRFRRCRPTSNMSPGPSATRPMSCRLSARAARWKSRPDGKALPQSQVSVDAGDWIHWSGNSRQLYWSQGPDLYVQTLAGSGDFAGGKQAAAPVAAHLGFGSAQVRPSGRIALTNARIVTMRATRLSKTARS